MADLDHLDVRATIRDHIYGCFIEESSGLRSLDIIGEDNVMLETDYPHSDTTWPDCIGVAKKLLAGLPADDAVQDPARQRRTPLPLHARSAPAPVSGNGVAVDLFAGVRVVEVAQFVFVPVTGALLADWGADVVKIEHPVYGDGYRGLVSQGIGASSGNVNVSMEMANRGKRSVGLDLKTAEGREILLGLVERADVFLTNSLPSSLEKLQLGVDDLPRGEPAADLRARPRLRRARPRRRQAGVRRHRVLGARWAGRHADAAGTG